ncbi:hypothetical protein [Cellulomonas sp. P5_E12]
MAPQTTSTHSDGVILSEWHTWKSPTYAPNAHNKDDVGWPQTYVGPGKIAPTTCGTTYQQDLYKGTRAQIDTILADGKLTGPNPPEDANFVKQWYFVSSAPCVPTPVAVLFDVAPVPPTCEAAGSLNTSVFPIDRVGYVLTVDRAFDGPGMYTITATAKAGYQFSGPGNPTVRTATVAVLGATGYQSTNRHAPCYTPPPECVDGRVPVWHTWTGGPVTSAPAVNAAGWHATSGNPQSANHVFANHEAGVPYFVSHGSHGKGDWFLWTYKDCPPTYGTASASWTTTPPTCEDRDGSGLLAFDHATLTAATLNGANYPNLGDFPEGVHPNPAPSGSHWTLTFTADAGYRFAGNATTKTISFDVPAYKTDADCTTVYPVPALFNAEPTGPSCTAPGALPTGLDGVFANITVAVTPTGVAGQFTITVTAKPGVTLAGLDATKWTINEAKTVATRTITLAAATGYQDANPGAPCFQRVLSQPPAPQFTDVCGTANDTTTLPANTADYRYDKVTSGNTVTVTVVPIIAGDVFPEGTQTVWTSTFTDVPCPTTTTTSTPPTVTPANQVLAAPSQVLAAPTTSSSGEVLAATGAGNPLALAVLALLVLLLGTSGLVVAHRR